MEDLIKEVEGRFKVSIADSAMMWLVQQAMDKAHEKVKSRRGVITRLNEISKFYELAVMQLDGCLKFVQEETGSYILESDHEEVLLDLREIRDRLQCRLKETELAISEKDRELTERSESELRLKQALEMKENELVSLRVNLERTRSGGVEEFIKSNLEGTDKDRDGEFSELKNSVDQQVMNIRQKLEPKYKLLAGEDINPGVDNKKIEKMGGDIDVLKGILDLAFSKMHNAIFLSELGPIEQTWRWSIEKDIVSILIKGFMEDFKKGFEVEKKKLKREASAGSRDHLLGFLKEILLIRCELECLVQFKGTEEYSSENSMINMQTEPHELKEEVAEEDDGINYVAKMIKNHESIIRRKSEELVLPKPEPPIKRQKSTVSPRRRVEEVISRLDNLINLNTELGENFSGDGGEMQKETCLVKRVSEFDAENDEKVVTDDLDDVWEKMHKKSVSDESEKITMLQQVKEDADLQAMILEDTYLTLFRGLISGFCSELHTHSLWSLITEDMHESLMKETINEGNERIEAGIRENIHKLDTSEGAKDPSLDCPYCLENILQENIQDAFLKKMLKEWNKCRESFRDEGLFRQKVDCIVFEEILRDVSNTTNHVQSDLLENIKVQQKSAVDCIHCSDEPLENEVKDDVLMVFLRALTEDWDVNTKAYNDHEVKKMKDAIQKEANRASEENLQVLDNFMNLADEKLGIVTLRVEKLRTELHLLIELVASLREKESVYRKAFVLRCENLQKAEAEVDLLGDQVDALLGLLEKIHLTLSQHPLVLQQNSEMSGILELIKKELFGVLASQ